MNENENEQIIENQAENEQTIENQTENEQIIENQAENEQTIENQTEDEQTIENQTEDEQTIENQTETEQIRIEEPTKRSNKGLMIAAIVILLAVVGLGTYMFFAKQEDKMNEENEIDEVNKIEEVDKENETNNSIEIAEIADNIKKGNYYTKEMLISNDFKEVDINNVNMNEKFIGETPKKFEAFERVEIDSQLDGKKLALVELKDKRMTLSYYDESEVPTVQQTIDDIIAMRYSGYTGENGSSVYVFIMNSNNDCYKLYLSRDLGVKKVYNKQFAELLFEKVTTVSNVKEVYSLYDHATTVGAKHSYLVLTQDNVYRYIDDGKIYDTNTYKRVTQNVKIMNNRDIYLNDKIQSYKFKKAYMDLAFTGKINYIISNENYLYDEYLNLVHDKRIDSVLVRGIHVVTIFEDGKNFINDYLEVK